MNIILFLMMTPFLGFLKNYVKYKQIHILLFYVQFFEGATHRIEFTNESLSLIEIFKNELFSILKLSIDLNDLKDFPYLILTYTSIIFLFFIKNKIAKKIFFFIIFLYTISIVS